MKHLVVTGSLLLIVALAGAGCPTDNPTRTKDADAPAMEQPSTPDTSMEEPNTPAEGSGVATSNAAEGFTLTATQQPGQEVKLSWNISDKLDESNRFIIIRDEKRDPEHTGKNFWVRQYYTNREYTWKNVPKGEQHFRICITEKNDIDTCVKYSNDVEVQVE